MTPQQCIFFFNVFSCPGVCLVIICSLSFTHTKDDFTNWRHHKKNLSLFSRGDSHPGEKHLHKMSSLIGYLTRPIPL